MKSALILSACVGALAAMSAANALAAIPVIGRCESQAGGKYTSSSCKVKAAKGKGTFEFKQGAEGHLGITASSGEVTFVGASGNNYVCTASTATGVYKELNGKINSVEHVVWTFYECGIPAFGLHCTSRGQAAGTVVYHELKGKLGYLAGEKTPTPTFGLQLEPSNQKAFAEFECGGGAVNYKIESEKGHNCVIGELTPPNTMSTTISQVYETGSGANQKWNHFESTPTKICQLEQSPNGGPRELAAQLENQLLTSELPVEAHG